MSNQIIWEKKGVLSRYNGLFSPEIHTEALNKLFSDPRIDDISYIIGDYSGINGDLLTEVDVDYPAAMTAGTSLYLKNIKVALVATDKKIIGLCKLFIKLSNQVNPTWETQLFEDIKTARSWIESGN